MAVFEHLEFGEQLLFRTPAKSLSEWTPKIQKIEIGA